MKTLVTHLLAASFMTSSSVFASEHTEYDYQVVWDSPGTDYKDSMPLGNGDICINLWTEQNGDIVFLISKTDAWTENGELVKLGRVRVELEPSPFKPGDSFRQILKPREGEIEIRGDDSTVLHAWVDANAPVIHLEIAGKRPMKFAARTELWRTEQRVTKQGGVELYGIGSLRELSGIPGGEVVIEPDTVLPAKNNQVTWLHFNTRSIYPLVFENQHLGSLLEKYPDPLLHRAFGVSMEGPGLVSKGNLMLASSGSRTNFRLDLYALTEQVPRIADWQADLYRIVAKTDAVPLETARDAHRKWWRDFWDRSWIDVGGDDDAEKVTQGYAMQRFMNAIAGRGAMPMKFNGSILTVGGEPPLGKYDPAKGQADADYRRWGGNYWFQNTRHLYWPMVAAGDFDTLIPFFKMYADALPLALDRTRLYFKHDGACFPETLYFWGLPNNNDFGWGNKDVVIKNTWIRHYVSGGLELMAMMLDAYDTTQSQDLAQQTLLPLADAITTFYDQHWKRVDGKIRFDPAQSLETAQQAVNPAPDIAGLLYVLPRLLELPQAFTTSAQRAMWSRMLTELPSLPRGRTDAEGKHPETQDQSVSDGTEILFTAENFSKPHNCENPELYAVFPFKLFGVNLPDIQLARDTYDAKRFKSSTCWGQDGIQAADLGWADRAKTEVIANFTAYGVERFPWFWKQGHDSEPDMDNGGAGMTTLQHMLMQTRGDQVLLFPAWPKEWDVDFKLHAPKNTVIEGVWRDGKLEELTVTPTSREKDVILQTPGSVLPVTPRSKVVQPSPEGKAASTAPEFRYTNPITRDPAQSMRDYCILKVGDRWYMTGTSQPIWGGPNPGVRLMVSDNLIVWKDAGWAIDASKLPTDCPYNGRFWAPEIHRIHGKFWLTVNSGHEGPQVPGRRMDDHHVWLFKADAVTGPYSLVTPKGIGTGFKNDATLFADDDGRCYMYCSGGGLWQAQIDLETGRLLTPDGKFQKIIGPHDDGNPDWMIGGIEGPFVIKRDGVYWMFFSAWTRGYEIGTMCAESPLGPWTLSPRDPVFGTRKRAYREKQAEAGGYADLVYKDTPDPYVEIGHNSVFEGPDGTDWLCCHAMREGTQVEQTEPVLRYADSTEQLYIEPLRFENGRWQVDGPSWTEQTVKWDTPSSDKQNLNPGTK